MNLFRNAEKVLGITINQFTLKNTLNDALLYDNICKFKRKFNSNLIDDEWSRVSTFISLLYAKALNINEKDNPVLYWENRKLIKKQFKLATAIDLIVEANNLSILEYKEFKNITNESLSTKLYFKSLDLIKELNNMRIYSDLKQSINRFHIGLNKWTNFEEEFFLNQNELKTKLTFDNYNDYVLLIKDNNQLIRNWEEYIQSTYGNLLGYSCSSMALLADFDHNAIQYKSSFDFGSYFAFNYIINQQFLNYFKKSDEENLNILNLICLKSIKDDMKRKKIIETISNRRNFSIINDVKNSDLTLNQIKQYSKIYHNHSKNCLDKLEESDSKLALLQITNNLFDIKLN